MPHPVNDTPAQTPGRQCPARRDGGSGCASRRLGCGRAWLWALVISTGLAQAAAPRAAPDSAMPPVDLALQVLQLVNQYRASQAMLAWQPDADLAAIATAHSQRMAARRQIGHDGFDARFGQAGRRLCVENLAAGFDRAEPLLAAWLASPSHRDNLLAPQPRQAGLGQVAGYITLMACE